MIAASFAELVSIGMVVPFLGVLTSPELVFEYRPVQPLLEFFDLTDPQDLLLPTTLAFVAAVVLAAGTRFLLVWLQAKVSLAIVNELATNAYHRTLNQPYSVHISRSSSEVISGILSKVSGALGNTLAAVLVIISSQVILITILIALIATNPVLALSSLIAFGSAYLVIFLLVKKRLASDSVLMNIASTEVVKVLQEGLGGIRDVLLDGTQTLHSSAYRHADANLRKAQASIQVASIGPRFLIEALGMAVIATIAYFLASQPGGFLTAVPVMGALALGAQRVLPLLHQSYASWSQILGNSDSLRDALDLLDQPINEGSGSLPNITEVKFNKAIKLDRVGFRYSMQDPSTISRLSISLPRGSRTGIIGSTGSGKSTLVDIVMGLLQPTEGCLMIDDQKIVDANRRAWQRRIAHVPQSIFLSDATIAENIAFGVPREKIDHERVVVAAQQAQISQTIETWREQYQSVVGERGVKLSGGQRQRIGIARALYKQADVIIFDEATSALDNETEHAVMEAIDGLGDQLTIVIVAHRLTTLRNCTQIIELKNGKLHWVGRYQDIIDKSVS
ncbi:ATP-binding cassette domain-containing protein [Rhodobacterales bacterium LSUCC0387]|nr:ATP-binding cassette domain-containing protein [Rhodobacterales bacterium LSUCC0387]